MKTRLSIFAAFTLLAFAPRAAEAPLPLSVLYVGNSDVRAKDFESFLKQHFANVSTAKRIGFDPATAKSVDVVLLDWPQNQGQEPFPPKSCPLGPRETWSKPTVLLGSAGLHVACVWEVKGGAG